MFVSTATIQGLVFGRSRNNFFLAISLTSDVADVGVESNVAATAAVGAGTIVSGTTACAEAGGTNAIGAGVVLTSA